MLGGSATMIIACNLEAVLPHLDGVVVKENGQDGNTMRLDARPPSAQGFYALR